MGIEDRRPRDWAYLVSFNDNELPSLHHMIRQINETHNTQIIEDFNARCEERIKEEDPTVTKSEDLVVNGGLQQCLNIILGTSSTRWQYMGSGTGSTAATISDTTLVAEIAGRIDMTGNGTHGTGWRESVGMKLFFGAIGPESFISATYREIGVFNTFAAATMLNRVVFPNQSLGHAINGPGFLFSCIIEFCPVV